MGKGRGWLIGGMVVGCLVASAVSSRRRAFLAQRARNTRVRLLVIGAGVVGSTYAERMARWGMDVSLLARGARLRELTNDGLWIRDALTNCRRTALVRLVSEVPADEHYDLALVAVRYTQVREALEHIRPLAQTTPILLLQNNPLGLESLARWWDAKNLLMGFPATGGQRVAGEVRSAPLWIGPTVIGDPDGAGAQSLHRAVAILRQAGLRVQVQPQIVPWLRTHAAMIAVLAGCVYRNGGHIRQMAGNLAEARVYLAAVREAYGILQANGVPITPPTNLLIFQRRVWLQTAIVSAAAWAPWAPLFVDAHLAAAPEEMAALHDVLLTLARRAGMDAPVVESLGQYFPGR